MRRLTVANAEMAAAWDGPEGEHWAQHAERYERSSWRHWARFMDAVRIRFEQADAQVRRARKG